ncbi:TPA: TIGR04255 family protein [Vibrio alginolyticus]|uniref:TIGR04255 family protein n=1 Tax=Vibrio alginolyticus TaxID=663 RepID=UPI00168CBCD4|nr:TIGR04255 family protein [Vibrio alginolyticus]EKK7179035.1 TIGR04255 family protein [Vibrio alginolyticus]MCE9822295.1 TIGR04255 family protein [Vibrio alginolyticus]MCS0222678.1 TIGR04255 family protein [Vibrio alginolyticus]
MEKKSYLHAPLVMSLIDVRVAELPKFSAHGKHDELYEEMSSIGFKIPVKEIQTELQIEVPRNANSLEAKHSSKDIERWVFIDVSRTTSVYVSSRNIAIKTTNYSSHEEFARQFEGVLSAVEKVFPGIKNGAITRIGTRYVNLLMPKDGFTINDYMPSCWLPNSTETSLPFEAKEGFHNRLLMNYETNQGNLRVENNLFTPKEGFPFIVLPTDIMDGPDTGLDIAGQPWWGDSISKKLPYAILDIDLSNEIRQDFSKDVIFSAINGMRSYTREAFEMCVTSIAREHWESVY